MKKEEPILYASVVENIVASKFCVNCYPKRECATFTYKGDSLCEECFKILKQYSTCASGQHLNRNGEKPNCNCADKFLV